MKILIATRNHDKFKITKKFFENTIFSKQEILSLSDIPDNINDKVEIGDISNRSKEKAINVYKNIEENAYDYIIGIDDGIKIRGKVIENIKDYLSDIIDNKYLNENEIIYILKSYTFVNKNKEMKSITTEIPLCYKKAKSKINIKENSYPLNYVLCKPNTNSSLASISEEELNEYIIDYSKELLEEVTNFFKLNN